MTSENQNQAAAKGAAQTQDLNSEVAIQDLSFEQALGELETIVSGLEKGDIKLEEAIGAYERGAMLRKHCETKLKEAEARVEKIMLGPDGSVSTQSFDKGEA